ncbi:unnamed protein product [Phytomonas sp. Hart1]|nr:unnamed protein product [Phytomonas sp. Hart1]|eukprot:CCW66948.1 unnamed protein product [Phytomonas sp. isolate Hart1]
MERRRYIAPKFPHNHLNIDKNEVVSSRTHNHECLKRQRDLDILVGHDNGKEYTMREKSSIDNLTLIGSAAVDVGVGIEECKKSDDVPFSTPVAVCSDSHQSGESLCQLDDTSRTQHSPPGVKAQLSSRRLEFSRTTQQQYHPRYGKMDASHNFSLLSPIPSSLPATPANSQLSSHAFQRPNENEADSVYIKTENSNDNERYDEEISDGSSSGAPEGCVIGMASKVPVATAHGLQHYMHSSSDTVNESDQLRMPVQLQLNHIFLQTMEAEKTELVNAPTSTPCNEVVMDSRSGAHVETDFDHFKNTVDDIFRLGTASICAENMNSEVKLEDASPFQQMDYRERGKMLQEALAELPGYPRLAIYDRTHCPFQRTDGIGFDDAFHDRVQQELTNRVLHSTMIHQRIVQQWRKTNYNAPENGVLESNPESSSVIKMTPSVRIRRWSRQLLLEGIVDYVQLGRHLLTKLLRKVNTHFHDRAQGICNVDKLSTNSVTDSYSVKELVVEQTTNFETENPSSHSIVLSLLEGKRKQYDDTHARVVNLVVNACQDERNSRADAEADEVKKCEETARHARQMLHRVLQFHEEEKKSQRPQQDRECTKRRLRFLHLETGSGRPPLGAKYYS